MARLPSTINFPDIFELIEGRVSAQDFWGEYISAVQYWLQRLIRRTNDELIENFGTQIVNLELVLSGSNAKFGVNATTRLTKLMSLTTSIDPPNVPANSQVQVTLTFTGASQNDEVVANPDSDIETGLIYNVWAPSTNTIRLRIVNPTGSPIDPAARTWRISVRAYM